MMKKKYVEAVRRDKEVVLVGSEGGGEHQRI